MKRYRLLLMGVVCSLHTIAQNETDILRYSQQYNLGTARSQGAGGAFGAVGADFSSIYLNPAGLALYRRNEMHLSAAITANQADANFLGGKLTDTRTNFNIPSFGLVLSKVNTGLKGDATEGVVNYNFSFGHNRTNGYHQNINMEGYNSLSNVSQYYTNQANGTPYSSIMGDQYSLAGLAFRVGLIDSADNSTSYYSPWFYGDTSYRLRQAYKITRRGATDEYNFNAAVNIGDVVYFGAGLVLTNVRHDFTETFTESDPNRTVSNSLGNTYQSSFFKTDVSGEGNGVAGRFGIIIRPIDYFRVGLSAQTATRIHMIENYNYTVGRNINWAGFGSAEETSPDAESRYDIVTPARYSASATLMHPSLGFLAIDADMVDYSRGRLSASGYDFSSANGAARSKFQQAYNIRIGGELKLQEMYRVRLGYQINTSPYKEVSGISSKDLNRYTYSAGLGYTNGAHFVDFAAVVTTYKEYYIPYTVEGVYSPTGKVDHILMNFVLTGGVRF